MKRSRVCAVVLILYLTAAVGCTKKSQPDSASPVSIEAAQSALVDRGRQIYKLNCIACHNADPGVDGALGPSAKGASLELLTARILKATYPPGYKPKRETQAMPALPHLEKELPALHAYLNSI